MINELTIADDIVNRPMIMFFLIDTSLSMSGSKIGKVNAAMAEVGPIIRDISIANEQADIKIAILEFNSDVNWITPTPIAADDFNWSDLTTFGCTALGAACKELNKKLTRNGGFLAKENNLLPAIILMTDGDPTDNWKTPLAELKKNAWFKSASKIAIAIKTEGDEEIELSTLIDFTGTPETIIEASDINSLSKLIKAVTAVVTDTVTKPNASGKIDLAEENNMQIAVAKNLSDNDDIPTFSFDDEDF